MFGDDAVAHEAFHCLCATLREIPTLKDPPSSAAPLADVLHRALSHPEPRVRDETFSFLRNAFVLVEEEARKPNAWAGWSELLFRWVNLPGTFSETFPSHDPVLHAQHTPLLGGMSPFYMEDDRYTTQMFFWDTHTMMEMLWGPLHGTIKLTPPSLSANAFTSTSGTRTPFWAPITFSFQCDEGPRFQERVEKAKKHLRYVFHSSVVRNLYRQHGNRRRSAPPGRPEAYDRAAPTYVSYHWPLPDHIRWQIHGSYASSRAAHNWVDEVRTEPLRTHSDELKAAVAAIQESMWS